MVDDYLRKFLFEHIPIKGSIVRLERSWHEVCARAKPAGQASQLLAQTLCASALLTSNIKFRGSVSLQVQSGGALKLMLAQCTHRYELRGVARISQERAEDFLLEPVLSINLEPEDGGLPYQGIVELDQGGLARALQTYFARSEQLESRFWLAAGPWHCCGLMLQRMPGQAIDEDAWPRITRLASTLTEAELLGLQPEVMLNQLFHDEYVRLFKPFPVSFGCKCSQARVDNMIRCLGEAEARDILTQTGVVEVKCEYCGEDYVYDPIDISSLFSADGLDLQDASGVH
jgi:molecular chaperone Hsp33